MKLILGDNGEKEDVKNLKSFPFQIGKMEESGFDNNNNNYIIGIKENSDINQLLKKYEYSKDLKVYFYHEILYITIASEDCHYVIDMTDEDFIPLVSQIQKNKKILFGEIKTTLNVDYIYIYDIIN